MEQERSPWPPPNFDFWVWWWDDHKAYTKFEVTLKYLLGFPLDDYLEHDDPGTRWRPSVN
jgi:hypothetical protein